MTAGLYNFIVTQMGSVCVCCYGKKLLLQGSADFTVFLLHFFLFVLDLFARLNIVLIVFPLSEQD